MRDTNIIFLEGVAGDDVKFGRATNGREYCTFTLIVNNTHDKELGDENEYTRKKQMIRINCFNEAKTKCVDYLHKVDFKRGMRVNLKGWLSSRSTEIKGNRIIQLSVVVRDIIVVATTPKQVNDVEEDTNINDND